MRSRVLGAAVAVAVATSLVLAAPANAAPTRDGDWHACWTSMSTDIAKSEDPELKRTTTAIVNDFASRNMTTSGYFFVAIADAAQGLGYHVDECSINWLTCTIKPTAPARVAIDRPRPTFRVTVSGCPGLDSASADLVGRGERDYLWWDGTRTDTVTLYDTIHKPGTYKVVGDSAYTVVDDMHPRWAAGKAISIKYKSQISMSASRKAGKTTVTIAARAYQPIKGMVARTGSTIQIQTATKAAGPWKTVKAVRTDSKGRATFTFNAPAKRYYKAVVGDTATRFGSTSVTRRI